MNKYKVILFDLDGTLSDPVVGITKSVQYALEKMGIKEPDLNKLACFIGPPLHVGFAEYYDFDKEETQKAIALFRERFKEKGMFENELYPNIPALLQLLKKKQFILIVATSKPTVFAKQILKYFQIDHYFDFVVGSNLDGTRADKTEIIEYIINKYKEYPRKDFTMIGDRKHDIIGANNTGIKSIGVTYGYGSIEELKLAEPLCTVKSVAELEKVLVKHN